MCLFAGVPALGRGQGRSKGVTLLQHHMQDQSLWNARDLYNICQGLGLHTTISHLEHPSQGVAILAFFLVLVVAIAGLEHSHMLPNFN